MPSRKETLIYVARLSKNEALSIFELAKAFPQFNLQSELLQAVADVCVDRMIRADGCLQIAQQLHRSTDEETLRTAVGRAYYSIHHSLRAMALWQNKWDPDGHEESIQQFKQLLQDNAFVNKSGLAADDWKNVTQARDNRHIADYSPYDVQRGPSGVAGLSGNNWTSAAQFNCTLAETIFQAAFRVVGL